LEIPLWNSDFLYGFAISLKILAFPVRFSFFPKAFPFSRKVLRFPIRKSKFLTGFCFPGKVPVPSIKGSDFYYLFHYQLFTGKRLEPSTLRFFDYPPTPGLAPPPELRRHADGEARAQSKPDQSKPAQNRQGIKKPESHPPAGG
jgi:hypothetical protein